MKKIIMIGVASFIVFAAIKFFSRIDQEGVVDVGQEENSNIAADSLFADTKESRKPATYKDIDQSEPPLKSDYTDEEIKSAYEKAESWLISHGYNLLDGHVHLADEDDISYQNVGSDYNAYGDDILLELCKSGDAVAQLYYGLRMLDQNLDTGVFWLRRSVVNGKYTSAIQPIMDAYQRKINDLKKYVEAYSGEDEPRMQLELIENLNGKIISWAFAAKHMSDPFVYQRFVNDQSIENPNFEDDIQQYERRGRFLYDRLVEERAKLGMPEFSFDSIDQETFETLFSNNE